MPKMLDCQSFRFNRCYHDPKAVTDCKRKCKAYQSKFIKLYCQCDGDRSVGIWGDNTEVLIERRFVDDADYGSTTRDAIKADFAKLFDELWDDPSTACRFEDECWNCGKLKTECKCPPEYVD